MTNSEINKVIEYWFFVLERNNEDESKEWTKDGWWFKALEFHDFKNLLQFYLVYIFLVISQISTIWGSWKLPVWKQIYPLFCRLCNIVPTWFIFTCADQYFLWKYQTWTLLLFFQQNDKFVVQTTNCSSASYLLSPFNNHSLDLSKDCLL